MRVGKHRVLVLLRMLSLGGVVGVALAASDGALASQPATILFAGSESVSGSARQRLMSDPVEFPVSLGDELYVSFEFHGALGASIMGALPDSYAAYGRYAYQSDPFGGNEHQRAVGLATIDVESDFSRAVLTIGDSITEGYVSGDVTVGTRVEDGFFGRTDNYRNAWSFVAQSILGVPFANAGVSGQGVNDVLATFFQCRACTAARRGDRPHHAHWDQRSGLS